MFTGAGITARLPLAARQTCTSTTRGEHPATRRSLTRALDHSSAEGSVASCETELTANGRARAEIFRCGMAGGGPKKEGGEAKYIPTKFAQQGDKGSKVLPYSPTGIKWKRGGTGTTKWSIRANHGGG
jgi:hypothetical protein